MPSAVRAQSEVTMKLDDGSWTLSAAEAARGRKRPEAFGLRGMVCSAHPAAAAIGMTIIELDQLRERIALGRRKVRIARDNGFDTTGWEERLRELQRQYETALDVELGFGTGGDGREAA